MAGLAAPAVLGSLASRPVLGQSLHNCTPSGHISGFASPNPNGTICSLLGRSPTYYAGGPTTWPAGFAAASTAFKDAPSGALLFFADAYVVLNSANNNFVRNATVWDVLKGGPVNPNNGNAQSNRYLTTKSGFSDDGSFTLGREAVAACMSATTGYPNGFPISAEQVVRMFNNVITGGTDQVTNTASWNAAEVILYFQSLHS